MPGNSIPCKPGQITRRSDFRGPLSVRRIRWIRLGLSDCAGLADARKCSGDATAAGFQRKIQDHPAVLRTPLARGSRNHRLYGPRARSLRTPVLVMAKAAKTASK